MPIMPRAMVYKFLLAGTAAVCGAAMMPQSQQTKRAAAPSKPTYAEHVAPILNRSCVKCHRPGEVAPFSLIGYENAQKWSPMIAAVTEARRMPPWKAVHGYGEFLDENRLSETEIATLKAWHESGAPRGDKAKEPKPPSFPKQEWPLGTPDLVLQPDKPFQIEAEGPDIYRNFVVKADIKEPMWVRAMSVRPGNNRVVHHVITFVDGGDTAVKLDAADDLEGYASSGGGVGFRPAGTLGGWAPGLNPRYTPQGTAFIVRPGSSLVVQVHYNRTGKPEEDLTRVGLYLSKQKPEREMMLDWIFNFRVNIAPGEKEYKISANRLVSEDVTVYGAMPHMHLLGKSMKSWIEFPDGSTKPLVWVDDWDFNWQMQYSLKEPIRVPKGSRIRIDAVYDNSSDNPNNPNDPPKRVRWGEQTTDEMFLLIVAYTRDGES